MTAKINAAESIRGLACLAVVFSHLAMSFFPFLHHFDPTETTDLNWVYQVHHLPLGFLYSGDAAVFVFFVLSGYVLSYAILKKPEQFQSRLKNMMVKRYPRLMIPALTSCVIIWATLSIVVMSVCGYKPLLNKILALKQHYMKAQSAHSYFRIVILIGYCGL